MNPPDTPSHPPLSSGDGQPMTRAEAQNLGALIRKQERLLKTSLEQRAAEVMADFEAQLCRTYSFDEDEVWAEARRLANEAVTDAQARIAGRCAELGIPEEFAPSIEHYWFGRGQNATKERQVELRRAADAECKAKLRRGRTEVERWSLEAQTKLVAHNLTSDAAKAFLDQIPATDALLPTIDLKLIESKGAK